MKTKKYFIILSIVAVILCTPTLGQPELLPHSDESVLIAPANPALAGLKQLYVILEPSNTKPGQAGLIWEELQKKVEDKIRETGIKIAPGIHLGKGFRDHNIPELRVYMEMLKFADLQLYVFRMQVSLGTRVYLKQRNIFFKADAWQAKPVMQAVSVKNMPVEVTDVVLEQVEAFVHAWLAANPQGVKPFAKSAAAEYKYVASKNSKVFHKPDCSSAKKIKPENLIGYDNMSEITKDAKRPCKLCKP